MRYAFARFIIRLVMRLLVRVKVIGIENIPTHGAFIAVSNHLGRLDAPLAYVFLKRNDVTMLVAEKYKKSAVFRWLVRELDAIWVDRFNADLGAMRAALNRLKQGYVLVMAPEGTRSNTEALIEGHSGAGYMAVKAGVPLVAVGVTGTEDRKVMAQLKRLKRPLIKARVGKPFTLPPFRGPDREAALQQATDEIMCQIALLLPVEYHGVYADHPRLKELMAQQAKNGG